MTFDLGFTPFEPMIIFNDGKSGVGEHQTEDLVLENNAMYNVFGKIGLHTSLNKVEEKLSFREIVFAEEYENASSVKKVIHYINIEEFLKNSGHSLVHSSVF